MKPINKHYIIDFDISFDNDSILNEKDNEEINLSSEIKIDSAQIENK